MAVQNFGQLEKSHKPMFLIKKIADSNSFYNEKKLDEQLGEITAILL